MRRRSQVISILPKWSVLLMAVLQFPGVTMTEVVIMTALVSAVAMMSGCGFLMHKEVR